MAVLTRYLVRLSIAQDAQVPFPPRACILLFCRHGWCRRRRRRLVLLRKPRWASARADVFYRRSRARPDGLCPASHEDDAAHTLGQAAPAPGTYNEQMISCGASMFTPKSSGVSIWRGARGTMCMPELLACQG